MKPAAPRTVWVDVLRFLAVWMVMASHTADNIADRTAEIAENYDHFLWRTAFGCLMRPCVPFFAMITGFLLLPVKADMGVFYKKRIPRVAVPFFIWAAFYTFFPWLLTLIGQPFELAKVFFAWADPQAGSLAESARETALLGINFNLYTTHLWYMYMLIGLYLYMPIFSAWLEKAAAKAKLTYLGIWILTLFIPFVRAFNPMAWPGGANIWGSCSWNDFHAVYYFAGFSGYLLLGHLLGRMPPLNWPKTLLAAVPAFAAGYAIALLGFRHACRIPGATEAQMELYYTFCSPQVALMTAGGFLFIRRLVPTAARRLRAAGAPMRKIEGLLAVFTQCAFGIYLAHYLFLGPVYAWTQTFPTPFILNLFLGSVITFLATWLVVWGLAKLPGSKWVIG